MPQYLHKRTGLLFVLLPAGRFVRGAEDITSHEDERPARWIHLTRPFLIARTACSQQAWRRGVEGIELRGQIADLAKQANFPIFGDQDNMPVYHVRWMDCARWCQENGLELPTEAQWEYACRAGTRTDFSFGDVAPDCWVELERWMWYSEHNQLTAPMLESLPPNPWGLFDMHGTIWEWCRDRYDPGYYASGPDVDPFNSEAGDGRVHRGGAWDVPAVCCRSSARYRDAETYCHGSIGFRPSLTL